MKQALRQLLRWLAPKTYYALKGRFGRFERYDKIQQTIMPLLGHKVLTGPFAGMRYIDSYAGSAFAPKIIGCYEEELHPALESLIFRAPSLIVDVGCAEGYYAVGMALRCKSALVMAYDTDLRAQELCRRMATLNDVDALVEIAGECTSQTLVRIARRGVLLICDCEGYEEQLLTPEVAAAMASSDLLVELHEFVRPGLSATLMERFSPTHEIELITSKARDPEKYHAISGLKRRHKLNAVTELRPCTMTWAVMRFKTNGQPMVGTGSVQTV